MKSFRSVLCVVASLAIAATAAPLVTSLETSAVEVAAIDKPSGVHKPSGIGKVDVQNNTLITSGIFSVGQYVTYGSNANLRNPSLGTYLHDQSYNVLQRYENNHVDNGNYAYYEMPFRTPQIYGAQVDLWMSAQVYHSFYASTPDDAMSSALTNTVNMAVNQGTYGYTQIIHTSPSFVLGSQVVGWAYITAVSQHPR
ncbi:hypothetical protein BGZ83_008090 [Gryganskiella cystojenkinii]|nr:hypothetical protein BGZ83_008090 [Gryganskiella cystojenkinii]